MLTQSRGGRAGLWMAVVGLFLAGVAQAETDPWLRVTTPEFTVLTSLRQKEAVAWASDFAQFVAAMRNYFATGKRQPPPLTVVIFARERDFEGYRPLGTDGKAEEVAGFFSRQEVWSVAGLSSAHGSEAVRRTIFHEGTHWFLSSAEQHKPVWLEEGLAEVFSTFEVRNGQAEWGRAIAEHVALLNRMVPLTLPQLLATGRTELFHGDSLQTGIVYAESWAFVHYLIFGKNKLPRAALDDYEVRMHSAQHPDEAFKQAFGRSLPEMDREFRRYFTGGSYYVSRQPLVTVAPPEVVPATQAEVETALGKLALSGGRKDLAEQHARKAIQISAEAPAGHALLGIVLKRKADAAGSKAAFAAAAELGSRDFDVYFELALAEQRAAADDSNTISSIDPAVARRIANRYERAINLQPRFPASFQNLAGIINLVEPVGDGDREFLELGRKLYPADQMIRLGLAVVAKRMGDGVKAREQLDAVLAVKALPAEMRAFANQFDTAWEQKEIIEQVNGLAAAQKYAEAADFIGERLDRGVASSARLQLIEMRRQMRLSARGQAIKLAFDERRWADARRLLGELLESDAPAPMKAQARRSLEELDQRKLGLQPAS